RTFTCPKHAATRIRVRLRAPGDPKSPISTFFLVCRVCFRSDRHFSTAGRMDREATMRIGYAAGAFDLFHVGHLNLLRRGSQQCDVLIAGVVSDEMLREVKRIEPVIPTEERAEIVRNLRFVDQVHIETTPSKLEAWQEVRFTHFFKGDDWRGTPKGLLLEEQFAEVGVEIV